MIINSSINSELARLRIADLVTEAEAARLARSLRPQRGARPAARTRHLLRRFLHRGLAGVDAPTGAGMAEHAA